MAIEDKLNKIRNNSQISAIHRHITINWKTHNVWSTIAKVCLTFWGHIFGLEVSPAKDICIPYQSAGFEPFLHCWFHHPANTIMMVQVPGSLTDEWETCNEFPAPSFRLTSSWLLWTFGKCTSRWQFSLSVSSKKKFRKICGRNHTKWWKLPREDREGFAGSNSWVKFWR